LVQIKDLIIKRGFFINSDSNVREAVKLLDENYWANVLVVVENGKPVGMITEREIIKKVILGRNNPEKIKVKQIMSKILFLDIQKWN